MSLRLWLAPVIVCSIKRTWSYFDRIVL